MAKNEINGAGVWTNGKQLVCDGCGGTTNWSSITQSSRGTSGTCGCGTTTRM